MHNSDFIMVDEVLKTKITAALVEETLDHFAIVSMSDRMGNILYVNQNFIDISGYSRDELLGTNHRIVRSNVHPASFYQTMWETISQGKTWMGDICNHHKNGSHYWVHAIIKPIFDENGAIEYYFSIRIDITRLKQAEEKIYKLAFYDPLTQLANRTLLADRFKLAIARAQRQKRMFAVCMIDLDGFKPVNDKYGHEMGDRVLVEVAKRLTEIIRGYDTVARLGGDEFVLLINDIVDETALKNTVNRVLIELAAPYVIDKKHLHLSASIGSALYPTDNEETDILLRHADHAMYQAKQMGRNQHKMFDVSSEIQLDLARQMIQEVRKGLYRHELELYYQPKVNMRFGKVIGMEALLRWNHPIRGLLPPMEFLPHVEKNELIIDIGVWVMDQALQQLSHWVASDKMWVVSVNIAALHFQSGLFLTHLQEALHRYPNVAPSLLEIEILESVALGDIHQVNQLIRECQKLGVRFSLDDFGTGYSSLSYLKYLPVETIKIDQSFVRDLLDDKDDLALTQAVIDIGRVFDRKIIAEGVETAEHGTLLLRLGCDLAQGYGIAKPMPASWVVEWEASYISPMAWSMWSDTKWSLDDFPLLLAQHDHNKWVKNVIASVDNSTHLELSRAEVIDAHQCRFGHWYYGYGQQRYGHLQEFTNLEMIHNRVHEIGTRILHHTKKGDTTKAKELSLELLVAKKEILEHLEALQKIASSLSLKGS